MTRKYCNVIRLLINFGTVPNPDCLLEEYCKSTYIICLCIYIYIIYVHAYIIFCNMAFCVFPPSDLFNFCLTQGPIFNLCFALWRGRSWESSKNTGVRSYHVGRLRSPHRSSRLLDNGVHVELNSICILQYHFTKHPNDS